MVGVVGGSLTIKLLRDRIFGRKSEQKRAGQGSWLSGE